MHSKVLQGEPFYSQSFELGNCHLTRQEGFERSVVLVRLGDEGVVHIHCSDDDIVQEVEVAEGPKRRGRIQVEQRF